MTFTYKRLNENADRPVYKQIADQLRSAIESGELTGSSVLPSERELMEGFGVARGTARQAIAILRAEGFIVTERGRGALVRERPPVRRVAHERFSNANSLTGQTAYLSDISDLGRSPKVEMIELGKTVANDATVKALKLRRGDAVLIRSRRYFADDVPMQLATTYVSWRIAKGTSMVEENTGPGGIYARLKEHGHAIVRYVEEVTARPPLDDESVALELPSGVPVIVVHRLGFDGQDQPVELTEIVMASDRYVLSYETSIPQS